MATADARDEPQQGTEGAAEGPRARDNDLSANTLSLLPGRVLSEGEESSLLEGQIFGDCPSWKDRFATSSARRILDAEATAPAFTRRDVHVPRISSKAVAVTGMRRAGKRPSCGRF